MRRSWWSSRPLARRPAGFATRALAAALATLMTWAPALAYAQDGEPAYLETDVDLGDRFDPADLGAGGHDLPDVDPNAPHTEPDPSATPIALPSTEQGGSGVTPQAISLPSAEGSVEGMGESFSPVLSSGTATFSVPIAVAPGRAGVQPGLALSYATSGGNGIAGFGWDLAVPFISRQTDRGLPRYVDRATWHPDEDRFMYNGGQELVPVDGAAMAIVDDHLRHGGSSAAILPAEVVGWQQYRARIEGGFMRFFRSPDSERWVVQSPDGTRFDFGQLVAGAPEAITASANAVERDPERTRGGVYRWALTRMSDAHGSTVYYVHESQQGRSYLADVFYVSPASCGSTSPATARGCTASLASYGARVRLVYEARADAFAGYVSGWRIAIARRLVRIDVSAYDDTSGARARVRRYHLSYDPTSFHSLLTEVVVEGRPNLTCAAGVCVGATGVPEGSNVPGARLPPMRFEYTRLPSGRDASEPVPGFGGISTRVRTVTNSPPHSVDEARADLFDVNADGLPDLVVTDPARFRTSDGRPAVGVYFNGFTGRRAQPAGAAGTFSDAVAMAIPAGLDTVLSLGNANVVPMDIDGDGRGDLLHMPRRRDYGWWAPTRRGADAVALADQGWEWTYARVRLPASDTDPRIDLGRDGAHLRALDVNNDHLIDVVRTTGTVMQTWLNLGWLPEGEGRFGSYQRASDGTVQLSTEPLESCLLQGGTPIDFEDPEVRLGDMNGDGLQDIVQMRRGRVIYWPGRGEGVWGTGSRRCPRGEGADRYVEMANPPWELSPELDGVYLSDVDMDGAADLVQVRFREVDVWFNEAGEGWTRRTIARDMPAAPAFAPRVRFADVDGSATTDVVWANAGRWEYVDPTGGRRPRLLTRVHNGLGAVTTIEYGSSAEDYVRDLAAAERASAGADGRFTWSPAPSGPDLALCELSGQLGGARCTGSEASEWLMRANGSPVVSTVVRGVSTTDNLAALGRPSQVSVSRFAYHDAYYEGIEQEFRGFGAADATTEGDWNNPTVHTRTYFHQGRRPSELEGDRLAHNPFESLKGREYLTEVFDDEGVYLSSTLATVSNRRLATGLDGRPIHYAYVYDTNEFRYDTSPFVPGSASATIPLIVAETVDPSTGVPQPPQAHTNTVRSHALRVRADASHTTRVMTRNSNVTNLGHVFVSQQRGRTGVLGGGSLEPMITPTSLTYLTNAAGEWRTGVLRAYVYDYATHPLGTTLRRRVDYTYTSIGDVARSLYVMHAHDTFTFAGESPEEGSARSYTQTVANFDESWPRDVWGQPLAHCVGGNVTSPTAFNAACIRYLRTTYDTQYAQVVTSEQIFTRRLSPETSLTSVGQWDRGLGAIVSVTDPNGLESSVTHDGLGRLTSVTPPAVAGCSSAVATHLRYELTSDPGRQPLSRVVSTTELDCNGAGGGGALVSIAYVDGLGRTRATLSTNDPGSGPAWVRGGLTTLDQKGTVRRTYQADLYAGSDTDYAGVLALPASTPYAVVRYDAFGRTRGVIAEDGSVTWTSYHSRSMDVCDPLDNDPSSPFHHTCTTSVMDGFGRTIEQILRNVDPDTGETETHRLWSYYRCDGVVMGLVRARGGTRPDWYTGSLPEDAVVRTFTYDSHGRRLSSADPDTDWPGGSASTRSWRYLYNEASDLVAVRDPRGCGQNFFYDHAGRLRGEQYVSCGEAQPARAEQPAHTVSSVVGLTHETTTFTVDVAYDYDTRPSWATTPVALVPESPTQGRATGVRDRGQRAAIAYDDRGNAILTARQMALVSAPLVVEPNPETGDDGRPEEEEDPPTSSAQVTYDEAHTYVRQAHYDHAGRPRAVELPLDPDHAGTAPLIVGRLLYNARGLPAAAIAGLYDEEFVPADPNDNLLRQQVVVQSIAYTRDGLVSSISYGDTDDGSSSGSRTPTVSSMSYDVRRRPIRMRTVRETSEGEHPLDGVTVVADQELAWDRANNLVAVLDHRDPLEWPAGRRPQSVRIRHDGLYRVTHADYEYTQEDGSHGVEDDGTDWRGAFNAAQGNDPMRQEPATMAVVPPTGAGARVVSQTWSWDFLANQTESTDDRATFYERSLGAIANGHDDAALTRPTALYFAHTLGEPVERSGWLEADYGAGGNLVALTVHAQCHAEGDAEAACEVGTGSVSSLIGGLRESCECEHEQHFVYRWDELNRLAEARRYDRVALGDWTLGTRQRYRYDGANQRTLKQAIGQSGCVTPPTSGTPCERTALYVYPGDFERRGLLRGGSAYEANATLGTETQYVVAGARMVFRSQSFSSDDYLRDERMVVAVGDLLHTTSAAFDVRTGRLVEASTYYPGGGRETFLSVPSAAAEASGFTGKEADEEVGVVYFGERYLVPRLGRWASPDPLHVHQVGGGEALNSYHYVSGNLLQARDPLGLDWVSDRQIRRGETRAFYQSVDRERSQVEAFAETVRAFGTRRTVEDFGEPFTMLSMEFPRLVRNTGRGRIDLDQGDTRLNIGLRSELDDGTATQLHHFLQAVSNGMTAARSGFEVRVLLQAMSIGHEDPSVPSASQGAAAASGARWVAEFQAAVDYISASTRSDNFSMGELDTFLQPIINAYQLPERVDMSNRINAGASVADLRATAMGFAFGRMVVRGDLDAAAQAEWLDRYVGDGSDRDQSVEARQTEPEAP
ncbi:MAG: hypothetical protein KF729_15215 [Sandaracinaceae bacterium]|nr:hypothetical protein [Sandaracinaceae bacterium]